MQHVGKWKEQDLFEYLQGKQEDLALMENEYSRWDCVSKTGGYIAELKCRRKHYPTLLIEKKKYDALIAQANEIGYKAYYVNSTPKGIYQWDLTKVEIEWKVEHKHPATTSFGNRHRVAKEVGYLHIDDGLILDEL